MRALLLLILAGATILVFVGLCRRGGGVRELLGLHEHCADEVVDGTSVKRAQFFYVLPCTTPVGPVSCSEIIRLAKDPTWQERVQISEAGTEEWLNFECWSVRYRQQGKAVV